MGYGGLPNEEGILEMDAAYMDGDTFGTLHEKKQDVSATHHCQVLVFMLIVKLVVLRLQD